MPEPIVTLNEESLRSDLRELVRKTVEDTLNGLLEAEADELVGAGRHGRTAEREAYRAGQYDRGPTTSSGEVTVRMPKLKGARLATAAIERHRRRESSVEEAMIEMCLAGVSSRRIEDVSEIIWGPGVSAATVSNLVNANLRFTVWDCGGDPGPNPSYAASRPKSLRYCMGLL